MSVTDDPRDRSPDLIATARDWWEFQRRARGSRDERKELELGRPENVRAAHDVVEDVVAAGGPRALAVILALLEATPAGAHVVAVGAGPLEVLVTDHGDDLVEEIERCARQEPLFAAALALVWVERGHLRPTTHERLGTWVGRENY